MMAINAREILNEFMSGLGQMRKTNGEFIGKFLDLDSSAGSALDAKTKELIGVAIGVYNRCQYCIVVHTRNAYKAGATRAEILGAAEVAIAFGGGPSVAYSSAVLQAALNEFEHDFD